MNIKELVKSKTFWTGIIGIVTGIGMVVQGDHNGVNIILTSLVGIFIRDAVSK